MIARLSAFPRVVVLLCVVFLIFPGCRASAQTLEVKPDKHAIVKEQPTGEAPQLPDRLAPGTRVSQIGDAPRYYHIQLADGTTGWSYKGNFLIVDESTPSSLGTDRASLLSRSDVLKIIIIDVEVGDATLIICPEENGERDVILIDTGENDADRIETELIANGIPLSGHPIDRMFVTHYDFDHMGDAVELLPLVEVLFDRGDEKNSKSSYKNAANQLGGNRRKATLSYHEQFSGGVELECVAVNNTTDFDTTHGVSSKENDNSIALVLSFDGFDYFTGGDLTFSCEASLATGIRDCDMYHVNHHGSRATSSMLSFVTRLSPEVSIASNGTRHGHPTAEVALRLLSIGSKFYQTNVNDDARAHRPDPKFVGDDTLNNDPEVEDLEGATGTIVVVVDPASEQYFVIMPGLDLAEATFTIEH